MKTVRAYLSDLIWLEFLLASIVLVLFIALIPSYCFGKLPTIQEKVLQVPLSPEEQIIRQFKPLDLYYTGGQYQDEKFSYRLYTPPQLDEDKKYPLLLWFHGAGESGTDNWKNLMHVDRAVQRFAQKNGSIPAFILVPQAPSKRTGWFSTPASEDDMLTIAWTMLERTIQAYPIDEDCIVMAGVSSGGSASWEMGLRYPDRFAAIAPIASGGADESRASRLIDVPIWTFHNLYDEATPIDGARRMVAAVQAAGGRARFTEVLKGGHSVWTDAFNDYDLLKWLLARHRGESSLWFYIYFADWRHIAVQFGLPVLIATACLMELRRRIRSNRIPPPSYLEAKLPDFSQLMKDDR